MKPTINLNHWVQLAVPPRAVETSALAPEGLTAANILRHKEAMSSTAETLPADTRDLVRQAALSSDPEIVKAFDKCMGFARGPSQRTWSTELRLKSIDLHLANAWNTISGGDFERATFLAKEISAFKKIQWPSWQSETAPPQEATKLRFFLFYAFRAGDGKVPGGWRAIRAAVTRAKAAAVT